MDSKVEFVHISLISAGDTIRHNGVFKTVSNSNIKRSDLMGITLFGDCYNLGHKPVEKINVQRALP